MKVTIPGDHSISLLTLNPPPHQVRKKETTFEKINRRTGHGFLQLSMVADWMIRIMFQLYIMERDDKL